MDQLAVFFILVSSYLGSILFVRAIGGRSQPTTLLERTVGSLFVYRWGRSATAHFCRYAPKAKDKECFKGIEPVKILSNCFTWIILSLSILENSAYAYLI